jgi:phosphinothricin acetyltransferase
MIIRQANAGDAAAVAVIYGHHVLHGLGTFEEAPPTTEDIAGRIGAVLDRGLPYLVAEDGGAVVGFAYAAPFRPRAAYRYTVEDSVYIAPDRVGEGLGKALVARVIAECEALGLRQMIAVVGDSANLGSIALHKRFGFEFVGTLRSVGFKFGRWVDTPILQRALQIGDKEPPPP